MLVDRPSEGKEQSLPQGFLRASEAEIRGWRKYTGLGVQERDAN